jgi:hypothetical protein
MSGPMPFTQLDDRGRRMLPLILSGPYVLLGALALFTAGIKHAAVGSLAIDLALCGLAAAWMLWMFTLHPAWRVRPRVMAVFFTVFVVIMAALVIRDPWFGFLTPAGYLYAFAVLPWPWRLPGSPRWLSWRHRPDRRDRATRSASSCTRPFRQRDPPVRPGLDGLENDTHAEQREQAPPGRGPTSSRPRWPGTRLHEQLLTQAREASSTSGSGWRGDPRHPI